MTTIHEYSVVTVLCYNKVLNKVSNLRLEKNKSSDSKTVTACNKFFKYLKLSADILV